jgi:hypothetical protein
MNPLFLECNSLDGEDTHCKIFFQALETVLTDLDFVDFRDYFGSKEPENRLKPNPLTVSYSDFGKRTKTTKRPSFCACSFPLILARR